MRPNTHTLFSFFNNYIHCIQIERFMMLLFHTQNVFLAVLLVKLGGMKQEHHKSKVRIEYMFGTICFFLA